MKEKYKILMVEDNPDYQKAAVDTLSKHGFEIDIVSTREDFLKMKEKGKYDFYLVDVFFPYKKGLEEEIPKEVSDLGEKLYNKIVTEIYSGKPPADFDFAERMTYVIKGDMPLGLLVAEDLKKENKNYLIVTAINHHELYFDLIKRYANIKELDVYLRDVLSEADEKSSPNYWEEVAKKIEEKLKKK